MDDAVVVNFGAGTKVDSQYALLGEDGTTQMRTEYGTQTADATHTIWTNTFTTAFAGGTVPVVLATYTEDPGDVRPIFVSSIASNQCLFNVTVNIDFNWVAIGQK